MTRQRLGFSRPERGGCFAPPHKCLTAQIGEIKLPGGAAICSRLRKRNMRPERTGVDCRPHECRDQKRRIGTFCQ